MNELLTMSSDAALPLSVVRVAAWTILHFFWQGALVAGLLTVALAVLRHRSADLRYGVACGALVVMAAMPVATFVLLEQGSGVRGAPAEVTPAPAGAPAPTRAPIGPGASTARSTSPVPTAAVLLDPALPWLVALWLAGVAALSFVHAGGWLRVRRLRHQGVRQPEPRWRRSCERLARRLGIRRPVELLESARVTAPAVVGWLKPIVLFPAATFTGLSPRQLESILAHELAHVRRHDALINALQVVLETLLFYHPAVWWASHKVRNLREHCCDDMAVAVCGDRMIYARALADLEELRFAAPVFALGADGGSLLERIRRLAGGRPVSEGMSGTLVATALVATAAALAFAGQPGFAQQEEAAAGDPAEVRIWNPPLVPQWIIAQVADEPGVEARPARDDARPSGNASPQRGANGGSGTLPIPLDELIEMKIHGLDDLLDEVAGTAYADLPTQQLLEMARFGVDRELISELDAAGYRDLQAPELAELAKFGVDGEMIAELQAAGFGSPPVAELVALAKFGVDGDYIQEMKAAGYQGSISELVEMSKFGVDAELVSELAAAGLGELAAGELVELAKFGVDGEYIQEMRSAGYQATSTHELVELAKFGVDRELIAELAELGLQDLGTDELVELAKFGVDGEYIQEMRSAGYPVTSTRELVELAKFGVDGEVIAELAELGYRDLATEDLVELAKFGADGDFIRELRDAGFENLQVDDLTRMARHGIDAEFLSKMRNRI